MTESSNLSLPLCESGFRVLLGVQYWMGRDGEYPPSPAILESFALLQSRVNELLYRLHWDDPISVTSGYRPGVYNTNAKGAPASGHRFGRAVDLSDVNGKLKMAILSRGGESFLESVGLYMESPSATPTWCHLDIGRSTMKGGGPLARATRIFKP